MDIQVLSEQKKRQKYRVEKIKWREKKQKGIFIFFKGGKKGQENAKHAEDFVSGLHGSYLVTESLFSIITL